MDICVWVCVCVSLFFLPFKGDKVAFQIHGVPEENLYTASDSRPDNLFYFVQMCIAFQMRFKCIHAADNTNKLVL